MMYMGTELLHDTCRSNGCSIKTNMVQMWLNQGVILIAKFFFLTARNMDCNALYTKPQNKNSQKGSDALSVPTPNHRCAP